MKSIELLHRDFDEGLSSEIGKALGKINLPIGGYTDKRDSLLFQSLQRRLDHRFLCVHHIFQTDKHQATMLSLIGPPGIYFFRVSHIKGIFRAKGTDWEELDARSRRFTPAKPNLLIDTLQMSQSMLLFFQKRGIQIPGIEPVIYFSNPGAHVDFEKPVVRIVLLDSLERFLSKMMKLPTLIEPEAVEGILTVLNSGVFLKDSNKGIIEEKDIFSLRDLEKPNTIGIPALPTPVLKEPSILKRLQFSRKQWTIIGIMLITNIIVLVALVLIVLILK